MNVTREMNLRLEATLMPLCNLPNRLGDLARDLLSKRIRLDGINELAFKLIEIFGIERGEDWMPSDCFDALEDKGFEIDKFIEMLKVGVNPEEALDRVKGYRDNMREKILEAIAQDKAAEEKRSRKMRRSDKRKVQSALAENLHGGLEAHVNDGVQISLPEGIFFAIVKEDYDIEIVNKCPNSPMYNIHRKKRKRK